LAKDAEGGNRFHAWAVAMSKAPKGSYVDPPSSLLKPLAAWADFYHPSSLAFYQRQDPPKFGMSFSRSRPSIMHAASSNVSIHIYSDYINNPPPAAKEFLDTKATVGIGHLSNTRMIEFPCGITIEYRY